MKTVNGYVLSDTDYNQLIKLYGNSNVINIHNMKLNYITVRSLLSEKGKYRELFAPKAGGNYITDVLDSMFSTKSGFKALEVYRKDLNDMSIQQVYRMTLRSVKEYEGLILNQYGKKINFKKFPNALIRSMIISKKVKYDDNGDLQEF